MITKKEKQILDYTFAQAENCLVFLQENDLVGKDAQVGFTVSRSGRYIDVCITYNDENGCRRIVTRTTNKWCDRANDDVLVVRA